MSIAVTTGSSITRALLLGSSLLGGGALLGPRFAGETVLDCGRSCFPPFLKILHSRFERLEHRLALSALGRDRHLDMGTPRGAYLLVDLNVRHPVLPLPVGLERPPPEVAACQVDIMLSAN